ncbi:MAG: DNA replication/repair protein RecF [Alphaproteobacteria bacterium]
MTSPNQNQSQVRVSPERSTGASAAGAFESLTVSRLDLANFRCYPGLRFEMGPGPVVLTGPNGAGKTNLLEALSLLVPGRGLRRARISELRTRGGASPWAIAARIEGPLGPVEIGTGERPGPADGRDDADAGDDTRAGEGHAARETAARERSGRRVVRIDGRLRRGQAPLADVMNALWLTPDMDRIFAESAAQRRRFLDRIVAGFDANHAGRVATFEHALRERSRLLRDWVRFGRPVDGPWLSALEERMAAEGVAIAASRRAVVARLDRASAENSGAFPGVRLAVTGFLENALAHGPALEAEDSYRGSLNRTRRIDGETGGACDGPHRADLLAHHRAKDMPADQCSTGEQKALLISIVLSVARLQALEHALPPVLLLDEVVAHLDGTRREALFRELEGLGGQAWLTGTDEALFDGLKGRGQFFRVAEGAIQPRAAT